MALKKFRPITPGQRHKVALSFDEISTSKPEKSLLLKQKRSGGRNDTGKMTIENIGGGHKQRYRIIDFKRDKFGIPAKVATIEYDPNRTANIALLHYVDGAKRYIIAPSGLKQGDTVQSGNDSPIKVGNALDLNSIPVGSTIHCVELKPKKGAQIARSAGSYVQFVAKEGNTATLRMKSGEVRRVPVECRAVLGTVSNSEHSLKSIGKAGAKRWLGVRPTVRGVAMNPIDHPHGGGEGRTSGGRHPVSPWGVPTKGYRTRSNKRTDKQIIRRRKK